MSAPFDLTDQLEGFTGTAPLFPLPGVAFFPHILLPLCIFESRQRRMVADALETDRLVALAHMKPGCESAALEAAPPIFETVCLGRITADERWPDGRYSLVFQGVSRARVLSEEKGHRPYRVGRLELCPDRYPPAPAIDREHRRRELLEGFCKLFSLKQLEYLYFQALDVNVPLGVLCDVLTHAMQVDAPALERTLSELNVDCRSDLVLEHIRQRIRQVGQREAAPDFPPSFSCN